MFTQDYFILSFLLAVLAYVYTNVLTEPTEIFSKWKSFLHNKLNDEEKLNAGLGYHPLFKVLVHCEKCFAGQTALWVYLILSHNRYFDSLLIPKALFILILKHVCFITLTILQVVLIKKIIERL